MGSVVNVCGGSNALSISCIDKPVKPVKWICGTPSQTHVLLGISIVPIS